MVEEPKRTIAYLCPSCRQSVVVDGFFSGCGAQRYPLPLWEVGAENGDHRGPREADGPLSVL